MVQYKMTSTSAVVGDGLPTLPLSNDGPGVGLGNLLVDHGNKSI